MTEVDQSKSPPPLRPSLVNSLEHDLRGGDAVHLADADLAPVTGDADLATAATTLGIAVLTATG